MSEEENQPEHTVAEKEAEAVKDDNTLTETGNGSEDSGDDSAVLIDHKDVEEQPRALQIVSIGTEEDCKRRLDQIT